MPCRRTSSFRRSSRLETQLAGRGIEARSALAIYKAFGHQNTYSRDSSPTQQTYTEISYQSF